MSQKRNKPQKGYTFSLRGGVGMGESSSIRVGRDDNTQLCVSLIAIVLP
ncbi:MAG: hypothetical protein NZZ60_09280 [Bacteroidia bacterium]|nr:hypothetical protein [Bacteroidia bacterium]MCX7652621.1 hypothetical protein [Bacteroidia bacterium]MDW8417026.1 hypothetical protein [Bacteroidia bacterium]